MHPFEGKNEGTWSLFSDDCSNIWPLLGWGGDVWYPMQEVVRHGRSTIVLVLLRARDARRRLMKVNLTGYLVCRFLSQNG